MYKQICTKFIRRHKNAASQLSHQYIIHKMSLLVNITRIFKRILTSIIDF